MEYDIFKKKKKIILGNTKSFFLSSSHRLYALYRQCEYRQHCLGWIEIKSFKNHSFINLGIKLLYKK